ncbi:hypothetical protein Acr_23g0012870 [Actinidia rufa]|uniref:F-box associated beta-propeller type 3 domain-containing protein n=1 Tax=Actinidia rufa TaxID=165716 RepID=A0A7J0GQ34_9ERIC|nr:hypothetical protein Acr_23g0012870 [Actinidia rufa]
MEVYLDTKEHYLLCSDDEKIGLGDEFLEPFKYLNGYEGRLSMVGACNGLICLGDPCFMDEPHIFVGNPSIRKLVALPIPSKPQRPQHAVVFGFGAHPTTYEYKVIRIVYLMRNGYVFQIPPKTEVYTQGAASWRDITSGRPPQGLLMFASPQAFVNGAVHWIGIAKKRTRGRYNSIVSFDIGVGRIL